MADLSGQRRLNAIIIYRWNEMDEKEKEKARAPPRGATNPMFAMKRCHSRAQKIRANFIKSIIFQRSVNRTAAYFTVDINALVYLKSHPRCELVNTAKIARRTVEDMDFCQILFVTIDIVGGGFRSFVAFRNEAWNTVVSGVRPEGLLAGVSAHVHFHSFRSMCMAFTRISDTCKAQSRGSCRLWGVAGMQSNSIHNLRSFEWNYARASNVAAKRIFGFVVRNIALGRRGNREGQRETSAKFSDVATTTATASFANADELNCAAVKKQLLQSRISIVANVKSAWI
ncbi:hypothetical protein ALC60_04052 [Trachymyrmex zeteki]|uniref:Uncharacterized protein n=1 Tax=Mycetomoellerius zeteki TaxID=64791 RepID=A0A151X9Q7_9HYME|nr:hypothetical protein ALC60_04052 [Trachymyrmex zeteki]